MGFNNPNPHASSILDLTSTNKGLLIPRMSTSQREALSSSAAEGLLVFDLNHQIFYFFNGIAWNALNELVKDANSTTADARGIRISNVAQGTAPQDVVTKNQLDTKVDKSLNWVNLVLLNGWSSGPQVPQVAMDERGQVFFRGSISDTNEPTNRLIAILPAEYISAGRYIYLLLNSNPNEVKIPLREGDFFLT